MSTLELKNINKIYPNGFHAVHDFNLTIEKGEFIVFVGPSGCGKSTTLRMIAGLEDISSGDFLIDGKRVNELGPREREVAMVFQSYALYPQMTVYDNIAFGLTLQGVDDDVIEKRVMKTAKILGLTEYLDRLPRASTTANSFLRNETLPRLKSTHSIRTKETRKNETPKILHTSSGRQEHSFLRTTEPMSNSVVWYGFNPVIFTSFSPSET